MGAAMKGMLEILDAMITKKEKDDEVDMNHEDNNGHTMLHHACENEHHNVVDYLASRGAHCGDNSPHQKHVEALLAQKKRDHVQNVSEIHHIFRAEENTHFYADVSSIITDFLSPCAIHNCVNANEIAEERTKYAENNDENITE